MKYAFVLIFLTGIAYGRAPITLETVDINTHNVTSIKRGAKFYAKTCMACHSIKFLKFDAIVKNVGIVAEKEPIKAKDWWLERPPPDLSLIARSRGADWLYTYLHSFYEDTSRPLGSNNLLVHNSNMPNPFLGMQGKQVRVLDGKKRAHYYSVLKLTKAGTFSPEQFDQQITDLVNFLAYASDPERIARERMGWWVLGFLIILACFAYCLQKEYWKDIDS